MKKVFRITFVVIGALIGIIVLDTLQAKIFDNSPVFKIRENINEGNINYIDKGILVDTYYYVSGNKQTLYKWEVRLFHDKLDNSIGDNQFDFYISKLNAHNDIRFNDYYTCSNRIIYLAGNIKEFYIVDNGVKETLENYISATYQTFDDCIKSITEKLDKIDTLRDGGAIIYTSKEKDITMIVCNVIDKNKNIFIGDYSMKFDSETMCQ